MNQQINLYQPVFRKQKKPFSAVAILQITCTVAVIFAGLYVNDLLQARELERQLADTTVTHEQLQKRMKELEAKNRSPSKLLEIQVKNMARRLQQQQAITDMLSKGLYTNTTGFSYHFEALARQHVEGSWLTQIEISKGGTGLQLSGTTYSPELVPVYMQRLLQEQVFSSTSFNVFGLQRTEDTSEEIHFVMGTGKEDDASS